jgi:hypothetical protein
MGPRRGTAVAAGPSIAARWNGKAWSFATLAGRKGFQNGLLSVSCGSPSSCLAPGTPVSDVALIGSWNGKSWRLVTTS